MLFRLTFSGTHLWETLKKNSVKLAQLVHPKIPDIVTTSNLFGIFYNKREQL